MFTPCILWFTLNANEHCCLSSIWKTQPLYGHQLNFHVLAESWTWKSCGSVWSKVSRDTHKGFRGGRLIHSAISGHKHHFSLCYTLQEFLLSRRPFTHICFNTTLFSKSFLHHAVLLTCMEPSTASTELFALMMDRVTKHRVHSLKPHLTPTYTHTHTHTHTHIEDTHSF